jgi:hypothetical protein
MKISAHLCAAAAVAVLLTGAPELAFAHGQWPEGPFKEWFENLQRPDNDAHPERKIDHKSLFCCGAADLVKTKFRVENGDERYPEDRWYAWINEQWIAIPTEKIVKDYAPDGQAYLFVLGGTVQCFVRPKGGT